MLRRSLCCLKWHALTRKKKESVSSKHHVMLPDRHDKDGEKPTDQIPEWKRSDVQVSGLLLVAVMVLLAYNHVSTHSSSLRVEDHGRVRGISNRREDINLLPSSVNTSPSSSPPSLPTEVKKRPQKRPESGYTLLVSFFATKNPPDHYSELLGALRANIANPVLTEVAVLYEPLDGMGCADLAVTLRSRTFFGTDKGMDTLQKKLRCIPWVSGQPTYKTMFQYASEQPDGYFRGATVVVANTDIVFDESLANLPPVEQEAYVLSVNHKPDPAIYEAATGTSLCDTPTTQDNRCPWPGWKKANTRSWDAFVLRPPLPERFSDAAAANGAPLDVFMNMVGGENRAKCGLEAAGLEVLNACMYVRTQHWHRCSQQMHNGGGKVHNDDRQCDGRTYPCMMYYYGPATTHVIDSSKICKGWLSKQGTKTLRGKAGKMNNQRTTVL